MGYEEVLHRVGSDGIFQKAFTIFGAFACIVPLMQNLVTIFSLKVHPFSCDYGNGSIIENSCELNNIKCPKFVFDPERDGYSLRNQYLLVCDRAYMGEFANMFFFIGLAIAGGCGGVFADRYGRKPLAVFSTSIMTIGGLASSFMPQLWMHSAFRTLVGLGIPGLYNGLFTLLFETLDTERRSHYYILIIQGWSSGVLFTALFGFLFPDFRHYEIAMGLATIPIVLASIALPESPRWLYVMGRHREALFSLNRIASINREERISMQEMKTLMGAEEALSRSKRVKSEEAVTAIKKEASSDQQPSVTGLLKYRYLLMATLVTWFNWFSVSMCYYGWSLMVGDLGDTVYQSLIYGGCLEIGGRFGVLFLSERVGRRPFAICLLWAVTLFSTIAAILVALGRNGSSELMIMGMLGRSFISWSWDILGLIMAEYGPTPVRVLISGTTSTWSRVGGIVSSQFTVIGRMDPNYPHYLIIAITFFGGLSCLLYPETRGLALSDSMEESDTFIKENFGCGRKTHEDEESAKQEQGMQMK